MKPANPDYPRMMFHQMLPPVTVNSEDEEAALGPEWSRIIQAQALPEQEKPKKRYDPEPEEEPMVPDEEEPDDDEEPAEKPEEQPQESAPALKPRRGRPPAPMSKQKRKA